ncbi:hypothetical protein BU24DRAFT_413734 [Aaosphaeria arxii CBS 175.79]|uniref:Membrane anchor Opy2 N-terminal domain-containing protein n=1 Tax=Aaosphaeria arxii CBS 175.79 TaxID=1450172 RepID=A0A6A5XDY4_9PLEO|nr:uncharacterized protein BU24DRAFT_413734 [Aaosphaeria arxii CBS 175.79]KAF2011046.1 hypothetical protein BU24DRAFT_413734 [Aaosphaeria arxii CBS 175.79]
MAAFTPRDADNVLRSIFKRCVECPKTERPSCSSMKEPCGKGFMCVYTPESCDSCAFVSCIAESMDPTSSAKKSDGPNVGAIAGGVVGGVVFVAIMVFVVWKFCLKGRRRPYDEGEWQEVDMATQEKADSEFISRRNTRASTHTVASMASSVLTRASNIIQIAYIPGVTNRSGPGSPDLLVPPVPPIPAMSPSTGMSSPYSASEQHFFVPDFRDSMASTNTDVRSSFARTSIAPSLARASVASTMYRQNAIVSPLPAQTIVRGKAAVVSVKSSGSNSPTDTPGLETPPVPQIDPKHTVKPVRIQMPGVSTSPSLSSSNSIRSTATLGKVKALTITKKKSAADTTTTTTTTTRTPSLTSTATEDTLIAPDVLVPPMRPLTDISATSTDDGFGHARARKADMDSDSESDSDDHSRARRSLLRDSQVTDIQDTPATEQSPFSDNSAIEPSRPDMAKRTTSSSSGLRAPMSPIREEASKRASHASKRTQSPFSDDNRSEL